MHMKTTSGSQVDAEQDDLDTLLAHAPRHTPPAGFAERVLAALHEEEEQEERAQRARVTMHRPWFLRPYTWGSAAAAACLTATLCLLPLLDTPLPQAADSLALDDALLVDEALDSIDDPDLISAICSVSTGAYSITTGGGAY